MCCSPRCPRSRRGLRLAGAEPATAARPAGVLAGLHCRRLTFEWVPRSAAEAEPGVTLRTGQVADGVSGVRGHVTGVKAGGRQVDADLVIDAGGRVWPGLTRALRGPAEGGDCGIAYVSRQYQMVPGAAPDGPVNAPFGVIETYPGYLVAVFIHDNQIRVGPDRPGQHRPPAGGAAGPGPRSSISLYGPSRSWPPGPTRDGACAITPGPAGRPAVQQLPGTAERRRPGSRWTVPSPPGTPCAPPTWVAGGAMTAALRHKSGSLFGLLEEHGRDFSSCSLAFDQWCAPAHQALVRRSRLLGHRPDPGAGPGEDVDLTRPLPPDLVIVAAQADPGLIKVIGPYQAMLALVGLSLDAVPGPGTGHLRQRLAAAHPPGPTRRELACLATAAASSHNHPAGEAALPAATAPAGP